MGVTPPFIYDKPSSYTFEGPVNRGFDPKAATRASWTPKVQKQKQDGPLLNFNRHPDSYYQSPYGNTCFVPMSPDTKKHVKRVWRTQRYARILALLAAIGSVFCIAIIRKTSAHAAWIIRVGPCVALVHSAYATRLFFRGVNSRPPASNASYQMFAALIDMGLLAFLGITCYMATMDYAYNTYQWDTIFAENLADYKVIFAFAIITGAEGALHLFSLFLDIWLARKYRKITNLPPDMNPLEEKGKLTGDGRKHKRSKSELNFVKHLSTSTMSTERFSQMSQPEMNGRRVPFKHTRTDSADRDSWSSQSTLNELRDPFGAKDRQSREISRPSSAIMPATNARAAGVGLEHKPARSSGLARNVASPEPASWLSYSNYEGVPAHLSDYAQHEVDEQIRAMSPVSALNEDDMRQESSRPQTPPQQHHPQAQHYTPQTQHYSTPQAYPDQENIPSARQTLAPPSYTPSQKRSREPLGMNPPTPVNQKFEQVTEYDDANLVPRPLSTSSPSTQEPSTPHRSALQETENVLYGTPSSRPASFVGSGTKSRFYGNLRNSLAGSPTRESRIFSWEEADVQRSDTVKTAESANFEVYASESDDEEYDPYRHNPPVVVQVTPKASPDRAWGQRQTSSSTGNDLVNGYAGLDPEFGRGMARRREVSGKAAEEGRAYDVTPTASPAQIRPGAAGWARFKGF